ncbi:MAG: hypothetical protein IJD02_00645 [Lachnospiraceae bacterium]|nr:hypothetical protein [Lachnospiraceae bacterium]
MKKFKFLMLSLLMCFLINNTAYAEEEYTIISGGYSKGNATSIAFDTDYVTSVNGLSGDEALWFTFTTPAQKGIFNIYEKDISNSEPLIVDILDSINDIQSSDRFADNYDDGYNITLSPSTTYYIKLTNEDYYEENSGNIKFCINYHYDFGGDNLTSANSISCESTYNAIASGTIDEDWFVFNTGNFSEYLISVSNISDSGNGCEIEHSIEIELYNEIEEELLYKSLYEGNSCNSSISLQKNKNYYLRIYHENDDYYDHDYDNDCFSDAYQFNISPVRTPMSSTVIKLSSTSYTYDGKAKKPSVTITYAGKTLKKDIDYTVSYSNNTSTGIGKVTITGKGNYKGTVTKTFQIKPKKLSGLKQSWRTTSSVTLTWSALTGVSGYDIYRKDSANGSYKYVGSTTNTKYINSKLTAGKTYYYVVRGYKKSGTTKVPGTNSDVITTTTTPGKVTGVKQSAYSSYYTTLK